MESNPNYRQDEEQDIDCGGVSSTPGVVCVLLRPSVSSVNAASVRPGHSHSPSGQVHPLVLNALLEWRQQSSYSADLDFFFPSVPTAFWRKVFGLH